MERFSVLNSAVAEWVVRMFVVALSTIGMGIIARFICAEHGHYHNDLSGDCDACGRQLVLRSVPFNCVELRDALMTDPSFPAFDQLAA